MINRRGTQNLKETKDLSTICTGETLFISYFKRIKGEILENLVTFNDIEETFYFKCGNSMGMTFLEEYLLEC